ncbi:MAG TPA: undecaprenyl-diphosphate phosphatase, partial [Thermomicrobiales bacterium]|nr:undecaprenyl-diphosphate phosphatase [Thermomicrobiales bacterium]
RDISQLRMRDTIFIGIAQAIALLPGTSRSGVTMSAALFRDLNRADSARYSFLLGFPLILAAGLMGLGDLFASDSGIGGGMIVLGIAVSAVSGLFAISWLIRLLQHTPLTGFVIYRIAMAAVILGAIATGIR